MLNPGDIVWLPFPFKEAIGAKVRPALVLRDTGNDEVICCMITTRESTDGYAIALSSGDLARGRLPVEACFVRANRLFTGDGQMAQRVAAILEPRMLARVKEIVVALING
jgi:mRNA interferase MazF